MAFKFDLSKFKKVGGDKHHTIMQHEDGHEIKIAHAPLSPKMRGQLAELPAVKMADGGDVPDVDPEKAKQFVKGFNTSGIPTIKDIVNNVKQSIAPEPSPKPTPKNYDEGTPDQPVSKDDQTSQPQQAPVVVNVNNGQPQQPVDAAQQPNKYSEVYDKMYNQQKTVMPANSPEADAEARRMAIAATERVKTADENQAIAKQEATQQQAASIIAENAKRQALGLAPMPVPQTGAQAAPQAPGIAPQQTAAPAQGQQKPAQDPFGNEAYYGEYAKGLAEQKAGIAGEAQALGKQGALESAALNQQVQNQQENLKSFQDHNNALMNERKAFMDDIKNQHIDPNHYMNSMGVGSKIANAIGLILGGAGGGGRGNVALDMLQRNIDRDIDAQKTELGKKNTLLDANFKQFQNMKDATDMTRVMQMDIVSNQLKDAAAKAMNPMAKAKALQAAGQLDAQAAPIISQIAMRRTLLGGMSAGRVDPAKVVNMLVPENQRAAANKELEDAQKLVHVRDNLLNAFDQLSQVNTVGNRVTSPIQTSKQVAALRDPLIASLSKESAGRFTDSDAKMIGSLFPAIGDSAETIATKRAQMQKIASEKMSFPILQTYGVDPGKMGRFNNQGASTIKESAPVIK